MKYLGIDPGMSGALACIDGDLVTATPFKNMTDTDIANIFITIKFPEEKAFAILESVHSMPGNSGRSMFSFGNNFGTLKASLFHCKIPYELKTPQRWQKDMECLTHGDKNVTKAKAQAMFPNIKITHAIADALLLAEYCRRLHTNV